MLDSHTHLIEEHTREYLDLLVQRMNEFGIDGAVLFTHQCEGAPEDSAVRRATEEYPGRFIPFLCSTVDISKDDSLARCLEALKTGFWKGVGELFLDCTNDEIVRYYDREGIERTAIKPVPPEREDDSLYASIFGFCGHAGLPVMVHCMDAAVMERALAKFPSTTFIWAHADHGFYDSTPMELMMRYPNLSCDIGTEFRFNSASMYVDQPPEWLTGHIVRWQEACRRFADRLTWGTDRFTWDCLQAKSLADGLHAWQKISEGLTEEAKVAISGGNILRLTRTEI